MKVISILQPWSSLIILGHKKIETRSWNTKYRGEILIHASAGKNKHGLALWHSKHCWDKVTDNKHFIELPFGAIIGKVNLKTCQSLDYPIQRSVDHSYWNVFPNNPKDNKLFLTPQEQAFGDYSPGRFGWLLSDPVLFEKPIPAKGKLGIWEFDESLLKL